MFGQLFAGLAVVAISTSAVYVTKHRQEVEAHKATTKQRDALVASAKHTGEQLVLLFEAKAKADIKLAVSKAKLESYEDRANVVLAKKGLVGIKATKATAKVHSEIECLTGGLCQKE